MNLESVFTRSLMANIERTTPGGIHRGQFIHRRHPLKTLLASIPFLALVGLAAFAAITHA